jgi:microsomal dipeptidase-like Zn-dependent dipeptidase
MKKAVLVLALVGLVVIAVLQFVLPGPIERAQNVNLPHEPWPVGDRAHALHATLFIADLHSDSLLWKRNLRRRSETGHMDVPRLQEGNVALQVFSATTKSPAGLNYERNEAGSDDIARLAIASLWPPRTWNSLYERAVYQLDKLKALDAASEIRLLTNRRELKELVADRERGGRAIGALYLIEGAHPLEGDIANLDRLFGQGLRIVGLTHFFDNELGGSLHGTSGAGLSEFGRAAVDRADALGLIIDLAHASPAMVEDVLTQSHRPAIVSHGGLQGACPSARNLDDDLMLRIAAAGGLVGIGYWDAAVCDITPPGVVASIRYAIDLLGVEHVALGSDYDGATAVLFDTSELAALTQAMLDTGFSEEEIRAVMGENVRSFLLEYLPGE